MTDTTEVATAEMLRRMQNGWDAFQAYLSTLTPEQLTKHTDAAGWRIQDHVIHLAVWEDGVEALVSGDSRQARMGVDDATWKADWHADDFFAINDGIYKRNKDKSLDEVLATFKAVHERLVNTVSKLSDADLMRPSFDPVSPSTHLVVELMAGNTFGHYEEHRPWIEAIAAGK